MMDRAVSLRPTEAKDGEFLCALYASTRADELAATDWTDEQKSQFCRMQFEAQTAHYREHYPNAEYSVIESDGQLAGRLYVDRWPSEIRIMDIVLLPEWCGKGIGTRFLTALQDEASSEGKELSIHVEKFNPALNLYRRLGFREKEDRGVYWLLSWRAAS